MLWIKNILDNIIFLLNEVILNDNDLIIFTIELNIEYLFIRDKYNIFNISFCIFK